MNSSYQGMTSTPAQAAEDDPQVTYYNTIGLIPGSVKIKQFFAVVLSDGSGNFSVDWSAAGFSSAPFHVSAQAFSPSGSDIQDRTFANINDNFDASGCTGVTVRGRIIVAIVLGGGVTFQTAPNTSVHITAYGT